MRSAGANTPAVEEEAREPPTTRAKVKDKSAKAPHISLSLGTEVDEEYKPQKTQMKVEELTKFREVLSLTAGQKINAIGLALSSLRQSADQTCKDD